MIFMLSVLSPILRVLECGRVKIVFYALLTVRCVIKGLQILLQYYITVVMNIVEHLVCSAAIEDECTANMDFYSNGSCDTPK